MGQAVGGAHPAAAAVDRSVDACSECCHDERSVVELHGGDDVRAVRDRRQSAPGQAVVERFPHGAPRRVSGRIPLSM